MSHPRSTVATSTTCLFRCLTYFNIEVVWGLLVYKGSLSHLMNRKLHLWNLLSKGPLSILYCRTKVEVFRKKKELMQDYSSTKNKRLNINHFPIRIKTLFQRLDNVHNVGTTSQACVRCVRCVMHSANLSCLMICVNYRCDTIMMLILYAKVSSHPLKKEVH